MIQGEQRSQFGDVDCDTNALVAELHTRGWCVVPQGLPENLTRTFLKQVQLEMLHPTILGESGQGRGIDLLRRETWPQGTQRHVLECVPPAPKRSVDRCKLGADEPDKHWHALGALGAPAIGSDDVAGDNTDAKTDLDRLSTVLDAVLGAGRWWLPLNAAKADVDGGLASRHWYVPVTFPEGATSNIAKIGSSGVDGRCDANEGGESLLSRARARSAADCDPTWRALCRAAVADGFQDNDEEWSDAEDAKLLMAYAELGAAWNHITRSLNGRTKGLTKGKVKARVAYLLSRSSLAEQKAVDDDFRDDLDSGCDAKGTLSTSFAAIPTRKPWIPINRRRVPWRGWHIDIGTDFQASELRTLQGQPAQGLVLLILLSSCGPGCGGTAMIRGSHRWVGGELAKRGAMTHEELNGWAVAEFERRRACGYVKLDYEEHEGDVGAGTLAGGDNSDSEFTIVEQVVGCAGDIILMHPLLLHGGTTNLGEAPRIMANGMVRIVPGRVSLLAERDCATLLNGSEDAR